MEKAIDVYPIVRLLSANNKTFIQVQEMYYERFMSSFIQMGCSSFWNCSWRQMVNWSKGKTCVDKWKVNDTSPKKKKLRLKGLLVVSPYFISQSSFSLPPLSPIFVRSSHQIATPRCQNSENGTRPAKMELTSSNWKKLAQQTLLDTWPKNKKRKLKCRIMQERVIWVDVSSRSNVHFFALLEMCSLWQISFSDDSRWLQIIAAA